MHEFAQVNFCAPDKILPGNPTNKTIAFHPMNLADSTPVTLPNLPAIHIRGVSHLFPDKSSVATLPCTFIYGTIIPFAHNVHEVPATAVVIPTTCSNVPTTFPDVSGILYIIPSTFPVVSGRIHIVGITFPIVLGMLHTVSITLSLISVLLHVVSAILHIVSNTSRVVPVTFPVVPGMLRVVPETLRIVLTIGNYQSSIVNNHGLT